MSQAQLLRTRRIVGEVNRTALARELGVSRSHVSQVLDGKYMPSLPMAAGMARKLGVTLDEFYSCLAEKATAVAVN